MSVSVSYITERELNYSPSQWSKRFNNIEVLLHYYKFAKEVSDTASKTLKCELNVAYGTTDRTKYDIYGTDLPKDAPIFIFIHGGYWQEGSKDYSAFAAPSFVGKGVKVITVGYDLCPKVKLEDIVSQIKKAVEEILKSASSLGSRGVWVSGHSAGAHLAGSLLFDELWMKKCTEAGCLNLLKGIVLISGIFNLEPLIGTSIAKNLKLTKDEIKAYSFTALDTRNNKPIQGVKVIIAVGECDPPGLINESRECAQKLITIADNVRYIFLRDNIDHFNIVENLANAEFVLTKIILDNIFYNY